MSREHLAQLKMARQSPALQPRALWVSETREKLAREARATAAASATAPDVTMVDRLIVLSRMFLPAQVWQTARAVGVFFLAGTVAVGGWIMGASASQDSLPGEALYGVKLAMEKTEVAVADVVSSPKVVAAKELDFAARRAAEAKKSQHSSQKAVALESLQQTIESAGKRLEKVVQQSPEQAVEVARVVSEKTDQILDTLHQATVTVAGVNNEPVAASTTAATIALNAQVQETEQLIEKAGVQAVQVLIEKGTHSDVKETVEKKLEKVATDMADIVKQAATVIATSTPVNAQAAALVPVISVAPLADISSSTTTSASTTVGAGTSVSPTAMAKAAPGTTTSTVQLPDAKQVEVAIGEAKTLLDGNNLQGALEKVKELYDIKNEAKNAVIQIDIAKSAGATVVPTATTGTAPVSVQIVPAVVQTSTATATLPIKEPTTSPVQLQTPSTSTTGQSTSGVVKTP